MAKKKVFSVCGMCSVRCPIEVESEDGVCTFIQGNPHAAGIEKALCARGGAGIALIDDDERPRHPLIRAGKRGEGKWRGVSWDEALDHVAGALKRIMESHGGRSILFSDRGGPFRDLHQAFVRGLGSPNYSNHDASCARNVEHAALSLFGLSRKDLVYDYRNAGHVVLQTRNLFESINVKEVNDLVAAISHGCKLTVVDIRHTRTAAKADRFFMIRPGTDYAFNLAVIHVLLRERLYDEDFAGRHIKDLDRLEAFVRPYTPRWAEGETGIPAEEIASLARSLAEAGPAVLWHPGWMTARYTDSFYVCRSAYIINALLGAIGAKGGLPLANTPGAVGRKGLKKLVDLFPKPGEKRADGVGWRHPQFDPGAGLLHLAFKAMQAGDPYPLKAYIAYRHDPLMGFPDPEALKGIFEKLDLLVSVTFSWSDTACFPTSSCRCLPTSNERASWRARMGSSRTFSCGSERSNLGSIPAPTGRSWGAWQKGSVWFPCVLRPSKTCGIISSRERECASRISRPPEWFLLSTSRITGSWMKRRSRLPRAGSSWCPTGWKVRGCRR